LKRRRKLVCSHNDSVGHFGGPRERPSLPKGDDSPDGFLPLDSKLRRMTKIEFDGANPAVRPNDTEFSGRINAIAD
jgi:hypothetical protein